MQNKFLISLFILFVIPCFVLTASCAKKKVEPDLSLIQISDDEAAKQAEEARLEELERQWSLEEERLMAAAEEAEREMIAARNILFRGTVMSLVLPSSTLRWVKNVLAK